MDQPIKFSRDTVNHIGVAVVKFGVYIFTEHSYYEPNLKNSHVLID